MKNWELQKDEENKSYYICPDCGGKSRNANFFCNYCGSENDVDYKNMKEAQTVKVAKVEADVSICTVACPECGLQERHPIYGLIPNRQMNRGRHMIVRCKNNKNTKLYAFAFADEK